MGLDLTISEEDITYDHIGGSLKNNVQLKLTNELESKVKQSRQFLDAKLDSSDEKFYGINTGFGSLCNVKISKEGLAQLQLNLIRSHAAGSGPIIPKRIVKLMMLLKIKSLGFGYSGISWEIVQRLRDLYNNDIIPVVRQYGSLGASGDLAPLAHVSLVIIGEGEVFYKGEQRSTKEVYEQLGWKGISLKSKEGIALLNGTQFCTAYLSFCTHYGYDLLRKANLVGAISLDAFDALSPAFDAKIQAVRRHEGQKFCSKEIRDLLKDSEIWNEGDKSWIQDPYSFRCIPQVHGASYDALEHSKKVLSNEINAVTDNPLIFFNEDEILSGGNFHAQPLALVMDYLSMALSELANISERRIFKLLGGERNLPAYLTPNSGINSGYMIPQYTAASIVSHNKQLCTPSSVDSIVSSNGQEDHVSMGANSAVRCYDIVQNVYRVLSIELMTAVQALEFRRPKRSSAKIEKIIADFRVLVPRLEDDRQSSIDMDHSLKFLKNLEL